MGRFLFFIYNLLMPFLTVVYLFYLVFTPRRGRLAILGGELKERLSITLPDIPKGQIWFHAASMGEVKAISVLAPKLAKKLGKDFFITVSTATGKKEALKTARNAYLMPIDFYPFVKRFIECTEPCMLVNAETEIWPSAFRIAYDKGIPIYLASARISPRTFKLYNALSPLTGFIFQGVKKALCQTDGDAERFSHLEGLTGKTYPAGNLKYDQNPIAKENPEIAELIKEFNPDGNYIFAAGCTHPEEEPVIFNGYKTCRKKIPGLKMIVAPRHLEQISLVKRNFDNVGIKYITWPDNPVDRKYKDYEAILINKTGVLQAIYRHSSICFVGGTLDKTGGHNLLEPALFGKPVLFGPNYRTARAAGDALSSNKGGFIVHDADEISSILAELLLYAETLAKASENSLKTLRSLQGATERTLREIP